MCSAQNERVIGRPSRIKEIQTGARERENQPHSYSAQKGGCPVFVCQRCLDSSHDRSFSVAVNERDSTTIDRLTNVFVSVSFSPRSLASGFRVERIVLERDSISPARERYSIGALELVMAQRRSKQKLARNSDESALVFRRKASPQD